ncbi:uncharacterized protein MONBRDRAFT_36747 [Monosiga brevicollis MX1]|uniref:Uncharacterized protein n=1 Tax=Monosiga brevicollis TaxID=81824 RepID=A9UX94_MONBE|nr:uncharacterized protein MONBRDRAFT_36747 [Monosiga brevicollis MX1]EDQ90348.1 predicted protein [Monosiga brevicollis MX1]|eukprot:XP_001745115.1 hypothetical protein [Monosiga brevicollis MX1]
MAAAPAVQELYALSELQSLLPVGARGRIKRLRSIDAHKGATLTALLWDRQQPIIYSGDAAPSLQRQQGYTSSPPTASDTATQPPPPKKPIATPAEAKAEPQPAAAKDSDKAATLNNEPISRAASQAEPNSSTTGPLKERATSSENEDSTTTEAKPAVPTPSKAEPQPTAEALHEHVPAPSATVPPASAPPVTTPAVLKTKATSRKYSSDDAPISTPAVEEAGVLKIVKVKKAKAKKSKTKPAPQENASSTKVVGSKSEPNATAQAAIPASSSGDVSSTDLSAQGAGNSEAGDSAGTTPRAEADAVPQLENKSETNINNMDAEPETKLEAEADLVAEPQPESKSGHEVALVAIPATEPSTEHASKLELDSKVEPIEKTEPKSQLETAPAIEPVPEPAPEPTIEPVPETATETIPETATETAPETVPLATETVPETIPETVHETIPETVPEPELVAEPKKSNQVEPQAPFKLASPEFQTDPQAEAEADLTSESTTTPKSQHLGTEANTKANLKPKPDLKPKPEMKNDDPVTADELETRGSPEVARPEVNDSARLVSASKPETHCPTEPVKATTAPLEERIEASVPEVSTSKVTEVVDQAEDAESKPAHIKTKQDGNTSKKKKKKKKKGKTDAPPSPDPAVGMQAPKSDDAAPATLASSDSTPTSAVPSEATRRLEGEQSVQHEATPLVSETPEEPTQTPTGADAKLDVVMNAPAGGASPAAALDASAPVEQVLDAESYDDLLDQTIIAENAPLAMPDSPQPTSPEPIAEVKTSAPGMEAPQPGNPEPETSTVCQSTPLEDATPLATAPLTLMSDVGESLGDVATDDIMKTKTKTKRKKRRPKAQVELIDTSGSAVKEQAEADRQAVERESLVAKFVGAVKDLNTRHTQAVDVLLADTLLEADALYEGLGRYWTALLEALTTFEEERVALTFAAGDLLGDALHRLQSARSNWLGGQQLLHMALSAHAYNNGQANETLCVAACRRVAAFCNPQELYALANDYDWALLHAFLGEQTSDQRHEEQAFVNGLLLQSNAVERLREVAADVTRTTLVQALAVLLASDGQREACIDLWCEQYPAISYADLGPQVAPENTPAGDALLWRYWQTVLVRFPHAWTDPNLEATLLRRAFTHPQNPALADVCAAPTAADHSSHWDSGRADASALAEELAAARPVAGSHRLAWTFGPTFDLIRDAYANLSQAVQARMLRVLIRHGCWAWAVPLIEDSCLRLQLTVGLEEPSWLLTGTWSDQEWQHVLSQVLREQSVHWPWLERQARWVLGLKRATRLLGLVLQDSTCTGLPAAQDAAMRHLLYTWQAAPSAAALKPSQADLAAAVDTYLWNLRPVTAPPALLAAFEGSSTSPNESSVLTPPTLEDGGCHVGLPCMVGHAVCQVCGLAAAHDDVRSAVEVFAGGGVIHRMCLPTLP